MTEIKVAVFAEKKKRGRGIKLRAYTRDYNPQWPGYNGVTIRIKEGQDPKEEAKQFIRALWVRRPDLVKLSN